MLRMSKNNETNHQLETDTLNRMEELHINTTGCLPINIERIKGINIPNGAPLDYPLYLSYYTAKLSEYIEKEFPKDIPSPIIKQLMKALNKGELCVYLSAVYHMLCSFTLKESVCKFYVGYLETTWSFNELETNMLQIPNIPVKNFHSCVMVDEKIVDVCYLFQNEGIEALGDIMYGDYPEGTKMWGWDLSHQVPLLISRYAKTSDIDVPTFIEQHSKYFSLMIEQDLDKFKKASI